MAPRSRLALDITMLAVFAAALVPSWTGIVAHECMGVALAAAFAVHVGVNARRIRHQAAAFFDGLRPRARVNLLVDGVLLLSVAAVTVTGLLDSHVVVPALGGQAGGAAWASAHLWSAWTSLGLAGLHFALHGRWALAVVRSFGRAADRRARPALRPMATIGMAASVIALATASAWGGAVAGRTIASAVANSSATAATVVIAQSDTSDSSSSGGTGDSAATTTDSSSAGSSSTISGSQLTCPKTGCTASTCHHGE
jgi:hypothetical protein